MLQKKFSLVMTLLCVSVNGYVYANKPLFAPSTDTDRITHETDEFLQQSTMDTPRQEINHSSEHYVINANQLLANPQLLQRAMDSVIRQQHIAGIEKILPIYRQWHEHNIVLAEYADGLLALNRQAFTQATIHFRKVIEQAPQLDPARLYLAIALTSDQQNLEALQELAILKNNITEPAILATIEQYHEIIQQRQKWHWNGSFSLIRDNNINQAPDQQQWGNFTFNPKIADIGLNYQFNASKRIFLPKGFYINPQFNVWGKIYQKEKDYNDLIVQFHTTLGLAKSQYQLAMSPYVYKRFYGNQAYSNTYGIRLYGLRHWHAKMSTALSWNHYQEYMQQDSRKLYNNKNHQLGLNIIVRPYRHLTAMIGITTGKRYGTRDLDDRYRDLRYQFLVEKQSDNGLGGRLSAMVNHKRFLAPNLFTNHQNRRDKEITLEFSVWHHQFNWQGFMPKLVWQQQKNMSNSVFNQYKKQGAYLEIEKLF